MPMANEPTIKRDDSGRFRPGASANPQGRPPSLSAAVRRRLRSADVDSLADRIVEGAEAGDTTSLAALVALLEPTRKRAA